MPDKDTQAFFTISDVAKRLQISERTLRRMMDNHEIEFISLNPLSKRRYARFVEAHIQAFVLSHSQGLPTPERPKRAYNKRVRKYSRKKRAA